MKIPLSQNTRVYVLGASVALIEMVLLLNVLWPLPGEEDSWPWVAGLMAFPVAAALILIPRPDNGVGRALGVVAISAGLIFIMGWYAVTFPEAPFSRLVEALARLPATGQFVGLISLAHLFPTGRCVTHRFRQLFVFFLATVGVISLIYLLSPSPLYGTGRENPLGILPAWLGNLGDEGAIGLLPFALIGLVSLVVRWRRAETIERSQLKWFLFGALFALLVIVVVSVVPEDEDDGWVVNAIGSAIVLAAFWSLPVAIVVAVLRYRLYDIDRIINRTLVYALLTATLAAVYLGLVVGLQAVLSSLSGGSGFAIALTTLAVAALFLPARSRIQRAVDRRFNRRAYDAARTIDAFATRMRDQIDLDTLRYEVLAVLDETMQPVQASLWLRRGEQR